MINFVDYSLSRITEIIDENLSEGFFLEYKEVLPNGEPKNLREFLCDVSAFANSEGGHIIFGVKEIRNDQRVLIRNEICGLSITDVGKEIRRLEDIISNGIRPQIPGLRVIPVENPPNPLIVMKIPKSFVSPHMVTRDNANDFYYRDGAGKRKMDLEAIRTAFLGSDSLTKKIINYTQERVEIIQKKTLPFKYTSIPKTILHVVPFSSISQMKMYNLPSIFEKVSEIPTISHYKHYRIVNPTTISSRSHLEERFMLDGLMFHEHIHSLGKAPSGYVLFLRNGVIESVETYFFNKDVQYLIRHLFGGLIVEALRSYLNVYAQLDIEPPFSINLSMADIQGIKFRIRKDPWPDEEEYSVPFDRSVITLPEIVIESFEDSIEDAMRIVFDTLWQAGGQPRSPYYDKDGNWREISRDE